MFSVPMPKVVSINHIQAEVTNLLEEFADINSDAGYYKQIQSLLSCSHEVTSVALEFLC